MHAARQALLRMMLVLAKTFKRLRDACLDIVFAHAQGNGKLFDRAAMGFLENAHIVAAGLLCLRFCVMNAATHGLCDLNRGGGTLLEQLLEIALLKGAVALGKSSRTLSNL